MLSKTNSQKKDQSPKGDKNSLAREESKNENDENSAASPNRKHKISQAYQVNDEIKEEEHALDGEDHDKAIDS